MHCGTGKRYGDVSIVSEWVEMRRLASSITCHAWNGDGSKVAFCPSNNTVLIYSKSGTSYALDHVLEGHDQVITGIDWAPKSNKIVTCSQDRNAFVWTYDEAENIWKPELVYFRIDRAATHVKWSPKENKFAVASGAKCVSICFYTEIGGDLGWRGVNIRKHNSTVLKVSWHPNNIFLATGCSDYKTRVICAHVKGVDEQLIISPFEDVFNKHRQQEEQKNPNKKITDKIYFGLVLLKLDSSSGWVHALKWSPSGNTLAFAAHGSSLSFVNIATNPPSVQQLRLPYLPLRDLVFTSETTVICVGEDANPLLFTYNAGKWAFTSELDTKDHKIQKDDSVRTRLVTKVEWGTTTSNFSIDTLHQNTLNCISTLGATNNITDFCTSGIDGSIAIWHVKPLERKLKGLKIA